jgi:hypothetical protein
VATIEDQSKVLLHYLDGKAKALRRKVAAGPVDKTHRGKRDHQMAQLADRIVSERAATATRRAAALGITTGRAKPAPAGGDGAGAKPAEGAGAGAK